MELTFDTQELHRVQGLGEGWAGRITQEDSDRLFMLGDETKMLSGWTIENSNSFACKDGAGFEQEFYAKKDGLVVFGDYRTGLYSTSLEALEQFVKDHPPFQVSSS